MDRPIKEARRERVNWIQVSPNRIQWQTLVNMIINFRSVKFLTIVRYNEHNCSLGLCPSSKLVNNKIKFPKLDFAFVTR
jgi:hypothetical protein